MTTTAPQASHFLRACRRQPVDRTPIWIMRQAGRYLPEYRLMRELHSMLELCRSPQLACEVTLQPLRRFDLDAAIMFSDLLIPLDALGVTFDIVDGRGPLLERPLRSPDDVQQLRQPPDLRALDFAFETVRLIKEALVVSNRPVPVIGFAGAPFTIASYMIEGGPSRSFLSTKRLMYREPVAWNRLMGLLADLIGAYVEGQVRAGADAVQIFDSWVGCLSPSDYRRYVLEPTRRVFETASRLGVPLIHFASAPATLLDLLAEAGGDVLGVDWRLPLDLVRGRYPDRAVQGNLDPAALLAPQDVLERMIDEVLEAAGARPGHVFNLGHGIRPETPIESVSYLVETVHEKTRSA